MAFEKVLWLHWLVSIRPLVAVLLTEVFKQCDGLDVTTQSFKSGLAFLPRDHAPASKGSHFSANPTGNCVDGLSPTA